MFVNILFYPLKKLKYEALDTFIYNHSRLRAFAITLVHVIKYFVKYNLDATIFTGSFNHLSTQHIDEEELIIENVNFKIVNSLKYKKTGSVKRVLSWLHWELKLFFSILFIKEKPDIVFVHLFHFFNC